jgi:L-arabinose isomerase
MLENDPAAWNEIDEWLDAAQVAHTMEHNRLGVMGHYYGGMLDVYSDLTLQCATFGGHVEIVEVDELAALRSEVSQLETERRRANFLEAFDVQSDCPADELDRAARTSVALDRLVERHACSGLAGLLLFRLR